MVRRLLASLSFLFLLGAAMPITAQAYNPLDKACSGNVANQSSACQGRTDGTDPIGGPNGAIKKVTLVIALLAGITAVVLIVVSGLMYVTSNGDPQKASNARNMLVGALIGLVIIAAAQGILLFILNRV